MLYALLAGAAFNALSRDAAFAPGIGFSASAVLRFGIALLGARIVLGDYVALGLAPTLLVLAGLVAALVGGWALARAVGLRSDHAALTAGAVSICGASAALAISAVLPKRADSEGNTLMTVIGVTTLSTVAMILYPLLAGVLDMTDMAAGLFMGASIHDVAQVVGAGYSVSDPAGETATMVKLLRVACLLPVVLILALIFAAPAADGEGGKRPLPRPPLFLVAFVIIMILNSVGIVPAAVSEAAGDVSRWCLLVAVAALGVKTSLPDIMRVGPKALAAMGLQTIWLAGFVLAGIMVLGL